MRIELILSILCLLLLRGSQLYCKLHSFHNDNTDNSKSVFTIRITVGQYLLTQLFRIRTKQPVAA